MVAHGHSLLTFAPRNRRVRFGDSIPKNAYQSAFPRFLVVRLNLSLGSF